MSRQILIETFPIRIEKSMILESMRKNDSRIVIPNMIIQRADVPNRNKRIYSRPLLEREASKVMSGARQAGSRGVLGELDHPESNVINLKNACLGVLDYRWKGNDMLGDVEILNTPSGHILKEILQAGYVPGISSRGLGSVESLYESDDPEVVEVQEDFELLCWDGVSDPSTHQAYFKEIRENFERRSPMSTNHKANQLIQEIICEISGICCIKN